jgi:hypothetical protein
MEVKTTMAYTHALIMAVEGSGVRSTGPRGKPSRTRAAGLAGPTGRPDFGKVGRWARQKSLKENRLPSSPTTGLVVLGRQEPGLSRSA